MVEKYNTNTSWYLDMCHECRGIVYPYRDTLLIGGQRLQFPQKVPQTLQLKGSQMNFQCWFIGMLLSNLFINEILPLVAHMLVG